MLTWLSDEVYKLQYTPIVLPFLRQFTWPWPTLVSTGPKFEFSTAMANETPNSTAQQMLGSMFFGTAISFM